MSELITIEATRRDGRGKNYARKLRAKGLIPAILVDRAGGISLQLDPKMLPKVWKDGKQFTLAFEGKTQLVKIQELQINSVKRTAFHVDLMSV
jgi:ribosomal protein L25 (general stress protein Ctc)